MRRLLERRALRSAIRRAGGGLGWALQLPADPSTYHTGGSQKAERLQQELSAFAHADGWSESHRCIMHLIARLAPDVPRRYLEIGVNEGQSLEALITALLAARDQLPPERRARTLFDELVLADTWGDHYGGTARGSHRHIEQLLERFQTPVAEQLVFLDGESQRAVPAYLRPRGLTPAFDVVYVDGNHSYAGALADVQNVLPVVGKMLLFDDIYHPAHCVGDRLLDLHRALVAQLKHDFYVLLNRRGFGFAAFIRQPVVDALPD